jgi:hypothetical protein
MKAKRTVKARTATLTPREDAHWIKAFEAAMGHRPDTRRADRHAWTEVQRAFPRLRAFDGCK